MSNPDAPAQNPDETATESLQLPDQRPIAEPTAEPMVEPASASRHGRTRTILEIVGGVVAAGLIVIAGLVGFVIGHAAGDDDGRWSTADGRFGPGEMGRGEMGPGEIGPGYGHHQGHGDQPGRDFGGDAQNQRPWSDEAAPAPGDPTLPAPTPQG